MIGTVIQNNIIQKADSNQKRITAELLKNRPSTNNETVESKPKRTPSSSSDNTSKSKKIIISQKSRLKAYLQTKKSVPPNADNVNEGVDKSGWSGWKVCEGFTNYHHHEKKYTNY